MWESKVICQELIKYLRESLSYPYLEDLRAKDFGIII